MSKIAVYEDGFKDGLENYRFILKTLIPSYIEGISLFYFNEQEITERILAEDIRTILFSIDSRGFEKAEDIYTNIIQEKPWVKRIVLSTYEKHRQRFQESKSPVEEVLLKPDFNVQTLMDCVKKTIAHRSSLKIIDEILTDLGGNKLSENTRETIAANLELLLLLDSTKDFQITTNGFTSQKTFTHDDYFFKLDQFDRLENEFKIYKESNIFDSYKPGLITIRPYNNNGIIVLENIKNKISPRKNEVVSMYVLSLMAKFHTAFKSLSFEQITYAGIHNQPYWIEGSLPNRNKKGEGYKRFIETTLPRKELESRIIPYRILQSGAQTVIHGDFKPENIVNGYLVDYAMVGRAFEVDELAYYFSDMRFNCSMPQFHNAIDKYIKIRSKIDPRFAAHPDYHRFLHSIAEDAFLTQLVLRHGVMNKRDMNDPEKFQQRQYYQHRILEMI
ncbi:hypothetical protein H6503_03090 [Candidatus Woesearchaeota archaeon]|nr:hypothetical protein [Candidatus Woesearchaeota archaeon]